MIKNQVKLERLTAFVQGLLGGDNGQELYIKYKDEIEQVTPQDAFEVFHSMMQKGVEPKEILVILDKAINVFYKSLSSYEWRKPEPGSFLHLLIQENKALLTKMDIVKVLVKDKRPFEEKRQDYIRLTRELLEFDAHYLKKENILFPYMEKKMQKFDGLAIMWALHEEIRSELKHIIEILTIKNITEKEFNAEFGKLLFAIRGLEKKEELILFPSASEVIAEDEWKEMYRQSFEYGFPFIDKPLEAADHYSLGHSSADTGLATAFSQNCLFQTETGSLNMEQISMIFNSLPVDLTFVDENNKVRYFTRTKDRIFPRSPAIVGRDVEKCHPPESVHTVHEIVESFRSGKQNHAMFWIQMKGRLILIQYYALRDENGIYKGVLEASQDVTDIAKLKGERRLLHWES